MSPPRRRRRAPDPAVVGCVGTGRERAGRRSLLRTSRASVDGRWRWFAKGSRWAAAWWLGVHCLCGHAQSVATARRRALAAAAPHTARYRPAARPLQGANRIAGAHPGAASTGGSRPCAPSSFLTLFARPASLWFCIVEAAPGNRGFVHSATANRASRGRLLRVGSSSRRAGMACEAALPYWTRYKSAARPSSLAAR